MGELCGESVRGQVSVLADGGFEDEDEGWFFDKSFTIFGWGVKSVIPVL
jgi:hypothetical protein